jgi:outer membrane protein TolC
MRNTIDVQLLWEFQNLGFGNLARIDERRSEQRQAVLDLLRTRDQVAADVLQAYAQVCSAAERLRDAEVELKDAMESVQGNFQGLEQTRRAGTIRILVIRPQEALQSVQALAQAYVDYYGAVADFNRAQFRLYRALGQPAQLLACQQASPAPCPPGSPAQGPSLPPAGGAQDPAVQPASLTAGQRGP